MASGLRKCDLNDIWWAVEWPSNRSRIVVVTTALRNSDIRNSNSTSNYTDFSCEIYYTDYFLSKIDDRNENIHGEERRRNWTVDRCAAGESELHLVTFRDSLVSRRSGTDATEAPDSLRTAETSRRLSLCESKLRICQEASNSAAVFVTNMEEPIRLASWVGGPDVEQ